MKGFGGLSSVTRGEMANDGVDIALRQNENSLTGIGQLLVQCSSKLIFAERSSQCGDLEFRYVRCTH